MDADEFRTRGHELIDWIADYVEGIERLPVAPTIAPGDVRARLPEHPPTEPEPLDAVLADLDEVVVPGLDALAAPELLRLLPVATRRTRRSSASCWPPGSACRA